MAIKTLHQPIPTRSKADAELTDRSYTHNRDVCRRRGRPRFHRCPSEAGPATAPPGLQPAGSWEEARDERDLEQMKHRFVKLP